MKTILVPVGGTEFSRPVMETAFTLGRDMGAHVTVLHVAADARDALPILGEGMSGAMIEEMLNTAAKEIADGKDRARTMFETFCQRYHVPVVEVPPAPEGLSASFVVETGIEDLVVAKMGKLVDLVVVGAPDRWDAVGGSATLNAALFETGHPVMVAPETAPTRIGNKVAIAWNGSVEAVRAISTALPILMKAEQVAIFTIETDETPAAIAEDLAGFLAWHGIAADAFALSKAADRDAGEMILSQCREGGVDLLVMGAYTHSRMREIILGGVTRQITEAAAIPVLLAH